MGAPRPRPTAQSRLISLIATLALLVGLGSWTAVSPPPAAAGQYVPGSCANWEAWGVWINAGYTREANFKANDDVVSRDIMGLGQTAPLFLDLHVPATGPLSLRANDGTRVGGDVVLYSGPAHATHFDLRTDGSFDYVPVAGYLGGDSFQYLIQDVNYCGSIATVTIAPPARGRALDDSYTTYQDVGFSSPLVCSAIGCGVLKNDLFIATSVDVVKTEPMSGIPGPRPPAFLATAHGTVAIQPNGSFTYQPAPGFTGVDTFYYGASGGGAIAFGSHGVDAFALNAYAKVTMNVLPTPVTAPIARADGPLTTDEDDPLSISSTQLLANDTRSTLIVRVDGAIASPTVSTSTLPTPNGSLAVTWSPVFGESNCTIQFCPRSATSLVYTPNENFTGRDSFSYISAQTSNSVEFSFPTEVVIDVLPVDDPPVLGSDYRTIDENTPITIDVLANDSDPDGDLDPTSLAADPCVELPVCIFKSAANGSWVINADDTITYTPTPNFVGTAGFHYQVSDLQGHTTRSVVLVQVNANPAVDDAFETDEDTALSVTAPGVLGNDRAGSTIAVMGEAPEHGSLNLGADGAFVYTPDANFYGSDSFTYTGLGGDTATVSIEVAPVNDIPSIGLAGACDPESQAPGFTCFNTDDRTVSEGQSVRVRGTVSDVEFDIGTISVDWGDGSPAIEVDYPCTGSLTCSPSPTATYETNCSLNGCTGVLFFDLSHTYADDAAGDGTYPIAVTATDVGGSRTVTTTATILNVAPSVSVAPECVSGLCFGVYSDLMIDAGGTATLRGRVTDPGTDDGTLAIDWGDGSADTVIELGCEAGEVCPQSPSHGATCLLQAPGSAGCGYFTATHVYAAPSGPDGYAIALTATDDDGGIGEASATAHVANAAPVATGFSLTGVEDVALEVDLAGNSADSGTPDDELTFSITADPSNGTLTGEGGTRTYTPDPDWSGSDEFTFEVCDPEELCDTAQVTIEVSAVDDPPVAEDDEVTTDEDTAIDIPISDLLENDSDIDSDIGLASVEIATGPSSGTATIVDDAVRYTPSADSFGTDTFTYEACIDGLCDVATVTVNVTAVNDAPTVEVSGPASATEGATVAFTFDVTDPDPGDSFTLEADSPSCGTGTLVGTPVLTAGGGSFSCRWTDGPLGATASVTVLDADGAASDVDTAAVTITNVAPVVTIVTSGPELVVVGAPIGASATFTDPGDDTHEATIAWGDGTVTALATVTWTGFAEGHAYTAAGVYTVTITVVDSDGATDQETFGVEVIDPGEAVRGAADDLSGMLDGASGIQARQLRTAIDALIGNNSGSASNGAIAAMESGDAIVAVSRILDAQRALASVTALDTSLQQALLAGVARVITEDAVAAAKAATGCDPTASASCSKGERKAFASIDAAVAAGHTRYAIDDWVGAVSNYLKAVKAAAPLS